MRFGHNSAVRKSTIPFLTSQRFHNYIYHQFLLVVKIRPGYARKTLLRMLILRENTSQIVVFLLNLKPISAALYILWSRLYKLHKIIYY